MERLGQLALQNFTLVGVNYKKTDVALRSKFAISNDQYASIIKTALEQNIKNLFILSTCNRTELYAVVHNEQCLKNLFCHTTNVDKSIFSEHCYIAKGAKAIEHLFNVAAGLDSQILGDYEIVGQLKTAINFAKQKGSVGSFLERLLNTVLHSSKIIKTTTALSGGTVSVSFAAIQCIKQQFSNTEGKKIVLIGTGKMGRNTCKNLIHYLHTTNLTLLNRTDEKAKSLAEELGVQYLPYTDLSKALAQGDIIIVSTHAEQPIIFQEDIPASKPQYFLDLSIPNNIDISVLSLPNKTLINVDELSKINDTTLFNRTKEIPRAKVIIQTQMNEFVEWIESRKNTYVLSTIKAHLHSMHTCAFYKKVHAKAKKKSPELIQGIVKKTALRLKTQNTRGCDYIQAINDYIEKDLTPN